MKTEYKHSKITRKKISVNTKKAMAKLKPTNGQKRINKKYKYLVLGAGIGGLAMASELKNRKEDFLIIEAKNKVPMDLDKGLHYLHSTDFDLPFSFKFKKNLITEEIWDTKNNTFSKQANIKEAIEYSKKIMESKRHITSILDPGKRKEVYVPDDGDMNSLIKAYISYIGTKRMATNKDVIKINDKMVKCRDGTKIEFETLISTMPLNVMYKVCNVKCPYELKQKELYITNFKNSNIVSNWLVVLYMSDFEFPPYRITAMNGILSMESMRKLTYEDDIIIKYLIRKLFDYDINSKVSFCWKTGRIFGLDHCQRAQIVKEFKSKSIYLLGRFANWNGKLKIDSTIKQAKEMIKKI